MTGGDESRRCAEDLGGGETTRSCEPERLGPLDHAVPGDGHDDAENAERRVTLGYRMSFVRFVEPGLARATVIAFVEDPDGYKVELSSARSDSRR